MDNDKLKKYIEQVIDQKLDAMNNMTIPFHLHNGWDNPQLDPKVALLGFPVNQVATASVAPTDQPPSGTFRFQVDGSSYYLWAYLSYSQPTGSTTGTLTGSWKSVALT